MVKTLSTILILLCSNFAHAERVNGEGEYSFGPDTAENVACSIAEEKAKQNAIANFVGELIESTSNESCKNEDCTILSTLHTEVSGEIKSIIKRSKQVYPAEGKQVCEVDIVADVQRIENKINFKVDGKTEYRNGERFVFQGISDRAGTVAVFNLVDKTYQRVYTDRIMIPNAQIQIPSMKYKMQANLPAESSQSKELLVFLFTDNNLTFRDRYSRIEFEALVQSLPFTSRKLVNHHVNIVR
jgi:hypothetical protein